MTSSDPVRYAADCTRDILVQPPGAGEALDVWNYWQARRGDRPAPARADIDPFDFPALMPRFLLVDVERSPMRFVYRLSGSQADTILGHGLTRRYVDELEPEPFARLLQQDFAWIVANRSPQMVQLNFVNGEGKWRSYKVLRLPLSDDGESINKILIFTDYA